MNQTKNYRRQSTTRPSIDLSFNQTPPQFHPSRVSHQLSQITSHSHQQPLNLVLDINNLILELRPFVGGHAGCNHGPRDAAGAAEGGFGGDEDVGDVLLKGERERKRWGWLVRRFGMKERKSEGSSLGSGFGRDFACAPLQSVAALPSTPSLALLFLTLSSHNNGKCSKISNGSVSAVNTINSAIPLLSVFVAIIYRSRSN